MSSILRIVCPCLAIVCAAVLLASPVGAQFSDMSDGEHVDTVGIPAQVTVSIASALLREDDPLPGAPGETVSSISNPVVNHVGGYALTVNTTGSGTTLSHIWGHPTGGMGSVILTEGTYGQYEQTSFESFHGFSNAGDPAYSPSCIDTKSGTTGLDSVWVSLTPVLVEEDPVTALPGQFSSFNSRPGITAEGIPYWVGGITDTQGGSSQNRVLFYGFDATPVIMGGDPVAGVPEPLDTTSSNIDFDYRFSMSGTNYIAPANVDSSTSNDGLIMVNGAVVMLGGSIVREASPVPEAIGGLPGENWDNFDFVGITETGMLFFTGDTDADSSTDEFVVHGGQIILREGMILTIMEGDFVLDGTIEGGYQNENGDWAVTWDVEDAGGNNVEALIFNGELILKEGDAVDLDGDGLVEPTSILANFTGITTLAVGDRNPDNIVPVYFTADIDTEGTSGSSDDTEAMFRVLVQLPAEDDHVTLCHCPPGNPNNCQTITVGGHASDAHMANHGNDYLGACVPTDGPGGENPEGEEEEAASDGPIDLMIDWATSAGSMTTDVPDDELRRDSGRSATSRKTARSGGR